MIPAIKAEFRKLFSVRSTYLIIIASLLITILFAGIINGLKVDAATLSSPHFLADQSINAVVFLGFIFAFAGLLLSSHEYRYMTIAYTLTTVNRRYKVMTAKFIVITVFAVLMSLVITFFSPLCTIVGASLADKQIGSQIFDIWSIIWRCIVCGWGYSMYAFIILMIIRNQIGAIILFLLTPLIGENILGLLLKQNISYLPFTALQAVAAPTSLGNHTTSAHQTVIVSIYIVIGLLVSTVLFIRRDAN